MCNTHVGHRMQLHILARFHRVWEGGHDRSLPVKCLKLMARHDPQESMSSRNLKDLRSSCLLVDKKLLVKWSRSSLRILRKTGGELLIRPSLSRSRLIPAVETMLAPAFHNWNVALSRSPLYRILQLLLCPSCVNAINI